MKIIIFGMGHNGITSIDLLGIENIAFFVDNDDEKVGQRIRGILCISYTELKRISNKYMILLSVDCEDIRRQLRNDNIRFYEMDLSDDSFFSTNDFVQYQDEFLLQRYRESKLYKSSTNERQINWFRTTYNSEINKKLVMYLKNGDVEQVSSILDTFYSDDVLYIDEQFLFRPGMRLIFNIITERKNINVCDLACGHGALVRLFREHGINAIGVDQSDVRIDRLNDNGGVGIVGDVTNTGLDSNVYDYAIALECLEHVQNPYSVLREMYRILKEYGKIYVTVPYGEYCDCPGHVRLFFEEDLFFVASMAGFKKIKIFRIPYLNNERDNNLFMEAVKE